MNLINKTVALTFTAAAIFRGGPWWGMSILAGRMLGFLSGSGVGTVLLEGFGVPHG